MKVSADRAQALGFAIRGAGPLSQDYSPEWLDVVVRIGGSTAVDSRLPLTYACIAVTGHQWCWVAKTELLEVKH